MEMRDSLLTIDWALRDPLQNVKAFVNDYKVYGTILATAYVDGWVQILENLRLSDINFYLSLNGEFPSHLGVRGWDNVLFLDELGRPDILKHATPVDK